MVIKVDEYGTFVSVSFVVFDSHLLIFMGTQRRARSVTCYMGSHGVTCHPTVTQLNAPAVNPRQAGWYPTYLTPEG